MKKLVFLFVFSLILLMGITSIGAEIELYAPLEAEIVPGRDFYIVGKIDRGGLSAKDEPLNIKIEIFDTKGNIVRTLESNVLPTGVTDASHYMTDYEFSNVYNDEKGTYLLQFTPPEIIFDGTDRDSIRNASNKIVVKSDYFAGVIYGGATKDFDLKYENTNGEPLTDIKAGKYTLKISAFNLEGEEVAVFEDSLTFGKSMPRFVSADDDSYAEENDLIKPNSLVGNWNPQIYLKKNLNNFSYVTTNRLAVNINTEFNVEDVRVLLNNLDTSDVSANLILGSLFSDDSIAKETYLYYDIGESVLNFEFAGSMLKKTGEIVSSEKDSFIEFTRMETYSDSFKYMDFSKDNGLVLSQGAKSVIYGIYSPLLTTEALSNGIYKFNSKISKIKGVITNGSGDVVYEVSTLPFLEKNDGELTSRFEFALEVLPDETLSKQDELTLVLYACDKDGKTVVKSNSISVDVISQGEFIAGYDDSYWGKDFCNTVNGLGQAPSDEALTPDEHITRGDFAAMVNRLMGFYAVGDNKFSDLDEQSVYFNDCITAQITGYMTGDESGRVHAEDYIKREEAMIILARISGAKLEGEVKEFKDSNLVSFWAKDYVDAMCSTGIISGFNGYLNPTENITVAEAAALITKTIKWMYSYEDTVINVDIVAKEEKPSLDISDIDFGEIEFIETPDEENIKAFYEHNSIAFEYIVNYLIENCPDGVYIGKVGNGLEIRDYKLGRILNFPEEYIEPITKLSSYFASFSVKYNPQSENAVHFSCGKTSENKDMGITYTVLDEVKGKTLDEIDDCWYYFTQN